MRLVSAFSITTCFCFKAIARAIAAERSAKIFPAFTFSRMTGGKKGKPRHGQRLIRASQGAQTQGIYDNARKNDTLRAGNNHFLVCHLFLFAEDLARAQLF